MECAAITTNALFSEWDQVLPDKAMTVAAVDRLVYHTTILEMKVDSYTDAVLRSQLAGNAATCGAMTGFQPHRSGYLSLNGQDS